MFATRILIGAAAAALVLGGCSSGTTEPAEPTSPALAAACTALDNLGTRLSAAGASIDETKQDAQQTVADAQAQWQQVQTAWKGLQQTLGSVAPDQVELFGQAQEAYAQALSGIDGDTPLADASSELQSARAELADSYDALVEKAGC